MGLIIADIVVGSLGFLIAYLLSRPPELRAMRLSQLILVPAGTICGFNLLAHSRGLVGVAANFENLTSYVAVIGFMCVLLSPNIAFHFGQRFCDFLDPQDWTPLVQEIKLRPIQRMIERDQYHEALAELEGLLKTHKPTYKALLLKTRLLYHFGSVDETMSVLLEMIGLSKSTQQQVEAMASIGTLEGQHQLGRKLFAGGRRTIRIYHELVLFPVDSNDRSVYRVIQAGIHEVEGTFRGNSHWLKLVEEDWGNATLCWEAVEKTEEVKAPKSILGIIAQIHKTISLRLAGRK